MRRLILAAAAISFISLTACGGGSDESSSLLGDTGGNTGDLRSPVHHGLHHPEQRLAPG